MKLTTKPRKGFTHVRGGRVLVTTAEFEISRDGIADQGDYDIKDPKDLGIDVGQFPYTPRPLESDGVTARIGDLAIEVIDVARAPAVLGYYFLSGPATGIIFYLIGPGPFHAKLFAAATACRVDVDPVGMPDVQHKLNQGDGSAMGHLMSCMVELTHRYQFAYFGELHVPNFDTIAPAVRGLHKAWDLTYEGAPPKLNHLIGSVHCPPAPAAQRLQGGQPVAYIHMQPAVDAGQYTTPPFAHELLETAGEDLPTVDFWNLDAGTGPVVVKGGEPS